MNYPWLDEYVLSKKGIKREYKAEWGTYRFMLKDKMVGLYSTDNEGREVITLKCEPSFGAMLRENYKYIIPGYYMNKVHWNSIDLNGDTPDEILKQMADNSYDLIFASLPKKVQKRDKRKLARVFHLMQRTLAIYKLFEAFYTASILLNHNITNFNHFTFSNLE